MKDAPQRLQSGKPPKIPIDCWAPKTPPNFVQTGMEWTSDGWIMSHMCTRCPTGNGRRFLGTRVGYLPRCPTCDGGGIPIAIGDEPTAPIRKTSLRALFGPVTLDKGESL